MKYRKRWELRVTLCGKRTKRTAIPDENKRKVDADGDVEDQNPKKKKKRFEDEKEDKKANDFKANDFKSNADFAMKRIKLKVLIYVFIHSWFD